MANPRETDVKTLLRRWWWLPLAILASLLLKGWVVGGMLQNTARELAADAAGIPIDNVEVHDGLDVTMTGFADTASRDQAVAAVDDLDSSWDVVGIVDEDAAPAAPAADPEPEPEEAEPAAVTTPAAISIAAAAGGAIVLDGTVATDEIRDGLVDQAIASYGPENVTDNLIVDPEAVAAEGGAMTITGLADDEDQRQEWISGAEMVAAAGGLTLTDDVTVAELSVEQQLNALFELEPIEFDTSRATIRSTSESTLDAAAEVINNNPEAGRLRVVGHTDSDGGDAFNLELSLNRAQAVMDYLVNIREVDPDRLEAEGRGETELKVEPESTPEDKQRNRRIEWELIS
jgi:outer membrane protein OmpA-like peptidoglycan-associated protein